ncbi:MAG: hypothetical protein KDG54_03890 [Geminicoccaceae bacterium]|nr:hypothetical protein [Geminicoccaceae bacterium]
MTDVSPYGATYPQGVDDDEINLDLPGIFRFLRRRKAIILSVTAIGTVVAAILGYNVKPSYTSEALLMIASGNQVVDLGSAVGGGRDGVSGGRNGDECPDVAGVPRSGC